MTLLFSEIKAFIALLIAMEMHNLPIVHLYWSTDPLYRVQPIAEVMLIKRFKKLRQAHHLNDNTHATKRGDDNFDKLSKLHPLVDELNISFQNECVSPSSQSTDEAMILFKGRNSMKQYMPLKPIKRGYKVWMCCDSASSYVYQFSIYTGKSDTEHSQRTWVSSGHKTNCWTS